MADMRRESDAQLPDKVRLGTEVSRALRDRNAVVALETAVVTHGLPAPHHLDAIAGMEEAVRTRGAVPAVCVVHKGCLWIGAERDRIADVAADAEREKASARDISSVLARGKSAGLTVSATLVAAEMAGITVFATGGIGGVHLGFERTGDVSADLLQLSSRRVVTVSAGVKSVLDIPRTLEYLETFAVPVLTFRADDFPAFYLRSSGVASSRVESAREAATIATQHWDLGMRSGVLVANPLGEKDALPRSTWNAWLAEAEAAARERRVSGKDVTPFLLSHVARRSGGATVGANLTLLYGNAGLAADIALAFLA